MELNVLIRDSNIFLVRGTTEFQFAFRCKSTRNYIFEVTNCGRITFIFLSVGGKVVSVVSFATVIWYVTQRALSQTGK